MAKSRNNVTNIGRKVRVNPGMLVFFFIFIYIICCVIFYMKKTQITLYQVTQSNISQDNNYTGLIIRDESVITTSEAGYVAYYVSNNSHIKNGQTVYSIDESGSTLDDLMSDKSDLSKSDYVKIKNIVNNYLFEYNSNDYTDVYSFKEDLNNKIFELTSDARYSNLIDQENSDIALAVEKSSAAGTISYYIDNLENIKTDDSFSQYFNDYDYSYTKLSSGTLLEKGAPVYKILNSNTWNIIINLSEEQYNSYSELTVVKCYLNSLNKTVKANIECFKQGDEYYAKLTLYKYAVNYFDSRFINIELELDNTSGLKIPNSSIIEKDFYSVPKEWFQKAVNSDSYGVIAYVTNDEGVVEYSFIDTKIYDEIDGNYLISNDLFDPGTLIQSPENGSDETYAVAQTETIKGVYNANNGYCEFNKIEVLYSNNEYTIVSSTTNYGIRAYDNIVLDATKTNEDIIIY